MKEITLYVPDEKVAFVKEFAKQLDIAAHEVPDFDIPEEHKQIVLERIRTAKAEDYISWEEAKKKLNFRSEEKEHV